CPRGWWRRMSRCSTARTVGSRSAARRRSGCSITPRRARGRRTASTCSSGLWGCWGRELITILLALGILDGDEARTKLEERHRAVFDSSTWTGIEARVKAQDGAEDKVREAIHAIRVSMTDL